MRQPLRKNVRTVGNPPKDVLIIHDRFQIMKPMNKVLDQMHRSEQNRVEAEGKKVLKGGRYLLLRNRISVEEDPDDTQRLEQLLQAKDTLHRVYLSKEELRLLWKPPTRLHAEWLLKNWLKTARSLQLGCLSRLCRTLQAALDRVLSYYLCSISTGRWMGSTTTPNFT